jgi:hypothetical protein
MICLPNPKTRARLRRIANQSRGGDQSQPSRIDGSQEKQQRNAIAITPDTKVVVHYLRVNPIKLR